MKIDSYKRIRLFNSFYSILKFINSKIKYSNQVVLSTAMIYFHKFFLSSEHLFKDFTKEDKLLLCASFIFLSCKATNRLISINSILTIVNEIFTKKNFPPFDINYIKERICSFEQDILISLDFDLNVDLPYKFLKQIKNFFEEENIQLNTKKLIELCCYYINDSFTLPLALFYYPDAIAISCASLLSHKFKFELNIDRLIERSSMPINKEEIDHIEHLLVKIYEKEEEAKDDNSISTKEGLSAKASL